jgi:formylglycine-generating enzyme required for sulfatase activity
MGERRTIDYYSTFVLVCKGKKIHRGATTSQHKLYLPEYLAGKHPVTDPQFAAFVKASGYMTKAEVEGSSGIYRGLE